MLIERYFARIGLTVCLAVLNAGLLMILFGNYGSHQGVRRVGTDTVIGASILAIVALAAYVW
jgi:hypothetical protein